MFAALVMSSWFLPLGFLDFFLLLGCQDVLLGQLTYVFIVAEAGCIGASDLLSTVSTISRLRLEVRQFFRRSSDSEAGLIERLYGVLQVFLTICIQKIRIEVFFFFL